MSSIVTQTCQCGAFEARISKVSPKTGNHLICYCTDCRVLWRKITRRWRKTPFFDIKTDRSIVKQHVLTEAEHKAAYAV